jgi:hypothetical protein
MKLPRLRTLMLAPLAAFVLLWVAAAMMLSIKDDAAVPVMPSAADPETVVIFGASGTAGDGILKAAMATPGIRTIHVITRRSTPRIAAGVAAGKVRMVLHTDYLDYSAIHGQIAGSNAVFWAIGTSSTGVDEETYARIHVDFPVRFVSEWMRVTTKPRANFHYISSSDISEDSRMMWARQKLRAERSLVALAEGSRIDVIAYRPDYIGPTDEDGHLGQDLLYWLFAPIGAAVKATQIGESMIEVAARGGEFGNGDVLGTRKIIHYSDAQRRRLSPPSAEADEYGS